jgi:hypothetical protein
MPGHCRGTRMKDKFVPGPYSQNFIKPVQQFEIYDVIKRQFVEVSKKMGGGVTHKKCLLD